MTSRTSTKESGLVLKPGRLILDKPLREIGTPSPLATSTDVWELKTFLHNGAGNFFQNVFHFQAALPSEETPYSFAYKMCSAFATQIEPDYLLCYGNDVIVDFYHCKRINNNGGPTAAFISGNQAGGAAGCISSGLAAGITWIVNAASNKMAKTFIAAVPSGGIIGDVVQGTLLTALSNFGTDILTGLIAVTPGVNAIFGLWTRKTKTFTPADNANIAPKLTPMTKRTVPII